MRYGFIGLGNLGGHLAASLLRNGFPLTVTDLDRSLAARHLALGAGWVDDALALAGMSDAIITCLPSPAVSENVLRSALGALKSGATWIEMSTLGRDEILRLAAMAGERGVRTLEAPVTGGVHLAAQGKITVLAGGDKDLYDLHKPALQAMGGKLFHMGPLGSAAIIKVITSMHCHFSIWKDKKPMMAGNQYADLSELCLYFIGGVIKHAKACNAFTNPTTNSYKRLVPGYEAPVLLAYSSRNRSASCRIPHTSNPKAKRVEVRFPDPAANPYLCFASLLMAGLDGVTNKIHPGEAMDKNLYDLPPAELKGIPTVCGSLREALASLDKDRDFLKKGGVFSDDQIDSYIELKMEENMRTEMTPHPVEYDMYYSC